MDGKKNWYIFQKTFSEALQIIKYPKTSIWNSCQSVNDYEYYNYVLIDNEEVYYYTTSYFVTEPAHDRQNIEEIANKLKNNKSI